MTKHDAAWLLPVLLGVAAAAYFLPRLPVRVAFSCRWPGRGALTWSPGRLVRITIAFRLTGWRVTTQELVLAVRTVGRIDLGGRCLYRREERREFRRRWRAARGSRGTPAQSGPIQVPMKFEAVRWHTVVGTGDAAGTGRLAGTVWALKGALAGVLPGSRDDPEALPRIGVEPRFHEAVFDTTFNCILVWRLWDIIRAARTARARPIPRQHEGVETWTTPSKVS